MVSVLVAYHMKVRQRLLIIGAIVDGEMTRFGSPLHPETRFHKQSILEPSPLHIPLFETFVHLLVGGILMSRYISPRRLGSGR